MFDLIIKNGLVVLADEVKNLDIGVREGKIVALAPSLCECEAKEVVDACRIHHGAYLYAYGGCGALYSSLIRSVRTVAFPELGPEALLELHVVDFPAICMIDSRGRVYGSK